MRALCVGLNPTLQRTLQCGTVHVNAVNRAERFRLDVAGKGANVARVLSQLGVDAVHLSHAGGLMAGRWRASCEADGFAVVGPEAPGEIRTCTTVIDTSAGTTTEFIEPAAEVDEKVVDGVRRAFREEAARCDVAVVSGSMAPGYPRDMYLWMIDVARELGVRLVLDISGPVLRDAVRGGDLLLKVNAREFGASFAPELRDALPALESEGRSVSDDERMRATFTRTMRRLEADGVCLVISQGKRPSLIYDSETDALREVPTIPMEPVNTIGCGDAMTAALTARLLDQAGSPFGDDLADLVEYSHTMAAINASLLKPGSIRDTPALDERD